MTSIHLAFYRKRIYIEGMTKKVSVFLVILFLILTVIVIGQKDKERVEPGKTTAKGKLVEGFPQLPIFPDAVVEKSYKKESGGKIGYEAVYLSETPPKEAMIWYRDELKKSGWSIYDEQIEEVESEFSIMAEREGKKLNVFAENEEGETEISVEIPLQ